MIGLSISIAYLFHLLHTTHNPSYSFITSAKFLQEWYLVWGLLLTLLGTFSDVRGATTAIFTKRFLYFAGACILLSAGSVNIPFQQFQLPLIFLGFLIILIGWKINTV